MANSWIALVAGMVILAAAVPYVRRIRHPEQKPLAAYLIFLVTFGAAAVVLFGVLSWLAARLDMGAALARPAPAVTFLLLVLVPAVALATWQARKPPWRQGPPE